MRAELFYNPLLLLERLCQSAHRFARKRALRGTVASELSPACLDTLELLDLLRPLSPRTFYDIGANVGAWTLLLKSLFPNAVVHAFEPLQQHFEALSKTTSALSNVHLHQVALGSVTGRAVMEVASFSDASSILPMTDLCRQTYGLSTSGHVEVPIVSLDEYRSTQMLPAPDVIKLDIQGYELEALRGAQRSLSQAQAVIAEVSFSLLYAGQCLFHEMTTYLGEHGFWLAALGSQTPLGKPLIQADVLFVRNDCASLLGNVQHKP